MVRMEFKAPPYAFEPLAEAIGTPVSDNLVNVGTVVDVNEATGMLIAEVEDGWYRKWKARTSLGFSFHGAQEDFDAGS